MKAECRSEDRRRAPESNRKNGRDEAQESQSRFRIGIVLVPSALFRGHSVGANSPDRLIQPIPSPGKPNAGATRPFFASLALCDFAFTLDSGPGNPTKSHPVAVSRSDVGRIRRGKNPTKSNLIAPNPTKSHHFETFFLCKNQTFSNQGFRLYRYHPV
jgi:hypothetical protein